MPDSHIADWRAIMHLENIDKLINEISYAVYEWVETTTDCEETAESIHSDIEKMMMEAADNFIWKERKPTNLIVLQKEETFDVKEIPLYDFNHWKKQNSLEDLIAADMLKI